MSKKRFELVFEVDEVNDRVNISGTNTGCYSRKERL